MSYYDDPDFADIYRQRDEDALAWAVEEREQEIAARMKRCIVQGCTGLADHAGRCITTDGSEL